MNTVKTVLVIDDSADLRTLFRIVLEREGLAVKVASHGRDALELLAGGLRPNLIVLDLTMDVMDGATFLAELEKTQPDAFATVPVIAMTGADSPPALKVKTVLRKPVDLDVLLKTIHLSMS